MFPCKINKHLAQEIMHVHVIQTKGKSVVIVANKAITEETVTGLFQILPNLPMG